MKRTSSILQLLTLWLFLLPQAARASDCALSDEQALAFDTLLSEGISRLESAPEGAAQKFVEASLRCPQDAALLGQRSLLAVATKNCHMARFWLEKLLEQSESAVGSELQGRALQRATELEGQCPNSARITVTSEARQASVKRLRGEVVSLELHQFPFEARIESGPYRLLVEREGYYDSISEMDLVAGGRHVFVVPLLVPADAEGELLVRCREGVDLPRTEASNLPCDHRGPVSGDTLTVGVESSTFTLPLVQEGNHLVEVRVPVPMGDDDRMRLADWGWIALSSGALLIGATVVLQIAANDLHKQIEDPGTLGTGTTLSITQSESDAGVARANLLSGVGIAAGVVGIAAVAAGVTLVFWPDSPYAATVVPVADEQSASFTVIVPF